jgi:hypothetical protein
MMARKGNKAQKKYTPKPPKGGFNSQPTNVLKPPLGGLGGKVPYYLKILMAVCAVGFLLQLYMCSFVPFT